MVTLMRKFNERATRIVARFSAAVEAMANRVGSMLAPSLVVDALTHATTAPSATSNFAWNVQPCVLETAICTHGKPYDWRLQELPT